MAITCAALITGKETVELREFPDPTLPATGVVVDIAFCGICGTDIHAYQSGHPYNPVICGHEWAGTISAIGSDVSSLTEGDRVVVAVAPSCGNCAACRAGQAAYVVVAPGDEARHVIKERNHGLGADIVYECVSWPFAAQAVVDLARRGGAMCLIGFADEGVSITPATWLIKEIRMTAALAYFHDEFKMAMGMMANGRARVEPMHTSTVDLEVFEAAIVDLAGGDSDEIKVLINPNMDSWSAPDTVRRWRKRFVGQGVSGVGRANRSRGGVASRGCPMAPSQRSWLKRCTPSLMLARRTGRSG